MSFDKGHRSLVEAARELERMKKWDDLIRDGVVLGLAALVFFIGYMVFDVVKSVYPHIF